MDYTFFNKNRRKSRAVRVGRLTIGGGARISVQSMLNTDTFDFNASYEQAKALQDSGCEIIRLTVPNSTAASTIYKLKEAGISTPLVADIHFDYKAAIAACEAGADKIRINPGNIGGDERVKAVCDACRQRNIPIRIGVNSGSLEKQILAKFGSPTAEALAESALYHCSLLEKFDFTDIIVAAKSTELTTTINANRIIAARCEYPLHIGVTEAGTERIGTLRSAIGIGSLLCDGIGDTLRVSLTSDPINEVRAGFNLLTALGLKLRGGVNIVSCPTCGRTKIGIIELASELERRCERGDTHPSRPITVAVMGCAVNGPGEAREADLGIAGGKGEALIFKKGVTVGKTAESELIDTLIEMINEF